MVMRNGVFSIAAAVLMAVLCGALGAESAAEPGTLQFDRLGYREGLVNSSVSSIGQDGAGFLWFATQGGLQRYDGYQMRLFASVPFDPASLSHQLVQTLYIDDDDTVWAGTYGGLNRLDAQTERVTHYRHQPGNSASLSDDVVVAIERDAHGQLWVGTLHGLNRLETVDGRDGEAFTRFLPGHTIRAIFTDSRDRLWVGSYSGLWRVQRAADGAVHFEGIGGAGSSAELPSSYVMAIDEDRHGNLWIGTWDGGLSRMTPDGSISDHFSFEDNRVYQVLAASSGLIYAATWGGGLVVLDPGRGTHETYTHDADDPYSIGHDVVYSLHEDRSGIIWIGTNGNAISKLDPNRFDYRFVHSDLPAAQRLSAGRVYGIDYDEVTDLLLIRVQGAGLNVRDPNSGTVKVYQHNSDDPTSLGNNNVTSVLRDHPDYLLVGTHAGIDRFYPLQGRFESAWQPFESAMPEPPIVYALMRDREQSLWVGTYDQGVLRLMADGSLRAYQSDPDDPHSLTNNLIYDIFQDSRGDIWVATNGGLNRYLPQRDGFQTYVYDAQNRSGISSNSTAQVLEDSSGSIWIASRAGGIMRYHRDSDSFSHITSADGLSSNSVAAFLEGEPGVFYVATTNGMNRVQTDPLRVSRIDERDGLHTREFAGGAARIPAGDLLFGAFSEIVRIKPRTQHATGVPPTVQFTAIAVMNLPFLSEIAVHHIQELSLRHTENFVRFEFAALEFSTPLRNRYRYRLVGIDADWIEADTRRFADYTNLPPGRFTFEVMAADSRDTWNPDPARLAVTIRPPFWRTGPFAAAAVVALLLLVWLVLRLHTRSLQLRAGALEATVKRRTSELSRANQELRQANATKDRFFSIVAHDLRGPISGMSSFMGRVVQEFADYDRETLKEISGVILDSARGLETMLENLLEWSQLQSGRLEIESRSIPLCGLLDSVFEAYRGAASAKSIELQTRCSGDVRVWADVHRTKTIVQNLVSNAIKFTPYGGTVSAWVEQPRQQEPGAGGVQPRVRLIIEDSGAGMTPECVEALFRQERVVRSSGTAGEKGTGLGLILCRELAELLGGSISLQSAEAGGTRAILELPGAPQ